MRRYALLLGLILWVGACGSVAGVATAGHPFDEAVVAPAGPTAAVRTSQPVQPARSSGRRSWLGKVLDRGSGLLDSIGRGVSAARDQVGDWRHDAAGFARKALGFLDEVSNLPGFWRQGRLDDDRRRALLTLAGSRPDVAWPVGRDISMARNAHRTNTAAELEAALRGPYDYFECDVRLEGPLRDHLPFSGGERRPITAHDSFQTNGLLFDDWLEIVKKSGRGIKIDFKESQALDQVLASLKRADVADGRLILNIGIADPGTNATAAGTAWRDRPVDDSRLVKIRRDFPGCIINLSPGCKEPDAGGHYPPRVIDQMIRYSKAAGPPVMFPLRAEMVTPEIVAALEKHGRVAIWNSISTFDPVDVAAEVARFRSWGVTGMIDLASSRSAGH